jgi:PadR family transcriptional regulator
MAGRLTDILLRSILLRIMFSRELKKGSTDMVILALLEGRPRHGYEIGKLIERGSGGRLTFRIGSLYPILCRLEDKGFISGRWVERSGERRRRYYRLTAEGRKALARERSLWEQFVMTINHLVGVPDV